MRAVAIARAVQAATAIDVTDAEDSAVATALCSFEIRDAFARILRDLFSARKKHGSKTTSAINARRFDREPGCELNFHHSHFTTDRLLERCAHASLSARYAGITGPLRLWLCHSDARQVFDLPARSIQGFFGLRPQVGAKNHKERDSPTASRRLAAHRSGRAIASEFQVGCEGSKLRLAAHRSGRASASQSQVGCEGSKLRLAAHRSGRAIASHSWFGFDLSTSSTAEYAATAFVP